MNNASTYPVALGLEHFYEEHMNDPEIADFGHGPEARRVITNRLNRFAGGGLHEMNKALDITGVKAQGGTTGADALKVEDLLPIITQATLTAANFAPAWNAVNKRGALSNVVENVLLTDLGGVPGLGFLDPSTLTGGGIDNNPALERADQKIMWYGHPFSTQLPAHLITALSLDGGPAPGGVDKTNLYAALNQLIIDLNYQHWWGNNDVTKLEANCFIQQTRAKHNRVTKILRYNCGGKAFDTKMMAHIASMQFANGSVATDFWWSPDTLADVQESLLPYNRLAMGTETDLLNMPENFLVQKLGGTLGRIKTHRDLHLDPILKQAPAAASSANAPTAPTTVSVGLSTDSVGNVLDGGTLAADGPYWYSVCAVSIKGRSAATMAAGSVSPNGSQKATVTITNGDAAANRFEIFRGPTNSVTTHKKIGEVTAFGIAATAAQTWIDNGEFLPGCSTGVLMCDQPQMDGSSVWMARQLLPITKYDLPKFAFNYPSIWMAGVAFQLRAPQFQIIVENIGRLS